MVSEFQHYTLGSATDSHALTALRQKSHATKFLRMKLFSSLHQINTGSYRKAVSAGQKPVFAEHQPFKQLRIAPLPLGTCTFVQRCRLMGESQQHRAALGGAWAPSSLPGNHPSLTHSSEPWRAQAPWPCLCQAHCTLGTVSRTLISPFARFSLPLIYPQQSSYKVLHNLPGLHSRLPSPQQPQRAVQTRGQQSLCVPSDAPCDRHLIWSSARLPFVGHREKVWGKL